MSDTLRSSLHARIRADLTASITVTVETPTAPSDDMVSWLVEWFLRQELEPWLGGLSRALRECGLEEGPRLDDIVVTHKIGYGLVEWVYELSTDRVKVRSICRTMKGNVDSC